MPSNTRGVLCTLIKTRAEGFMSELPEKVIPEKKRMQQCMQII